MKKYFAILTVLFTVILSSCSNDDITVLQNTVIRVNPSTVTNGFTYQLNAGDLDGTSSHYDLRIRIYIYDKNGSLVEKDEQTVANYLTTASFEVKLNPDEHYNVVALTDCYTDASSYVNEYWEVQNPESLSTFTIYYTQNDNLVYGTQEILGIANESIAGGDNKEIYVKPAGAIILTEVWDIHAYENLMSYIWVTGNRGNGSIDFTSTTSRPEINYNPNIDVEPYMVACNISSNPSLFVYYTYKFMMPQPNYILSLAFGDEDRVPFYTDDTKAFTIEAGHEYNYFAWLDPEEDGSGNYISFLEDVTGEKYESAKKDRKIEKSIQEYGSKSEIYSPKNSWKITELISNHE